MATLENELRDINYPVKITIEGVCDFRNEVMLTHNRISLQSNQFKPILTVWEVGFVKIFFST